MKNLRFLAVLVAALAIGSTVPAGAATNVATLTVNGTIANNCMVIAQPSTLTMSYDAVQDIATLGTSSFTYKCTKNASVTVTPASSNSVAAPNWEAISGTNNMLYTLWNSTTCTTGQLTNGTSETLSAGTGASQTYNVCALPNTGQTTLPAGTYVDTVTFTFNFTP